MTANFDSTTKFNVIPLAVWNRLNRVLFVHNQCVEDPIKNSICDCHKSSSSWTSIHFDFVIDPRENDLTDNVKSFELHPDSYLEEISAGPNKGKCLLLIKAWETE